MYPRGVGDPQRYIAVACQINQRNASQQQRVGVHESVFGYVQVNREKVSGSAPSALLGDNGNIVLRYPAGSFFYRVSDRRPSGNWVLRV